MAISQTSCFGIELQRRAAETDPDIKSVVSKCEGPRLIRSQLKHHGYKTPGHLVLVFDTRAALILIASSDWPIEINSIGNWQSAIGNLLMLLRTWHVVRLRSPSTA